jgi:hypothetical protein
VEHRRVRARVGEERGSASVELVAVLPFLFVACLIAAQLVAVGHAAWSAALAARAGARAAAVGDDPARAGRRALPPLLRDEAEVTEGDGVSVRVEVPRLLPVVPRLRLAAEADLEGGPGG